MSANTKCYGCGAEPKAVDKIVVGDDGSKAIVSEAVHPWVGVGAEPADVAKIVTDALAQGTPSDAIASMVAAELKAKAGLAAFPICAACQKAPTRPLKLHFFPREAAPKGVRAAGSSTLGAASIASTLVLPGADAA
jgi:hypothetical protein